MLNLFPEKKSPYFIWAYPWDPCSSGGRSLHLLCHALNQKGHMAFLVQVNNWMATNPTLHTPVLNPGQVSSYAYDEKTSPIVIYPEIVEGNPLESRKVVRWILGPHGETTYASTDKIYGYTQDLGENTLCLPTFDERIFYSPRESNIRKGDCYYAHKYDKIFGNNLLLLTYGMTRCEGTPEQVADILRSHEACYVYERSEILVNAKLCGCKILPVLTNYWDGKLPKEFFNKDKSLVSQDKLIENFEWELDRFIEETQRMRV